MIICLKEIEAKAINAEHGKDIFYEAAPDHWEAEEADVIEEGLDAASQTLYSKDCWEMAFDITGNDEESPLCPKIYALTKESDKWRHIHDIDYKKHMKNYLQPEEVFGTGADKGLLIQMKWHTSSAFDNLVLCVDRVYTSAPFVGLVTKSTTRKWQMNNGAFHPNHQVKAAPYEYTKNQGREANKRRRSTLVSLLEDKVSAMLQGGTYANQAEMIAALELGAAFLEAVSPYTQGYKDSGNTANIAAFLAESTTQTNFPFLLNDVPDAPAGTKVKDIIIPELTYT